MIKYVELSASLRGERSLQGNSAHCMSRAVAAPSMSWLRPDYGIGWTQILLDIRQEGLQVL